MNQTLSIGSIFSVQNDQRKLIVVGYNNNDTYIVCVCNEDKVEINKPYLIPKTQVDKVLSLGYVYENVSTEKVNNEKNDINNQKPSTSDGYQFDENGVVIGY